MDTKAGQSTSPVPQRGVIGDRRALVAAYAGNVVEWYDYAIYSGSATVLAAVLAPGGWAGITTIFAVFATSCLLRHSVRSSPVPGPTGSDAGGRWPR